MAWFSGLLCGGAVWRVRLGRLLLLVLDIRLVMADGAPGSRAEQGMVPGDMAGNTADRRTRQATCLRAASHEQ